MITQKQIAAVRRAESLKWELDKIDAMIGRIGLNKKPDRFFTIGHSPSGGDRIMFPRDDIFYPVILQALKSRRLFIEKQLAEISVC